MEESQDNYLSRIELGEKFSTFNLERAVCNHGFFMMSPNHWISSTKSLQRPLRLSNLTTSVNVSISQSHDDDDQNFLLIYLLSDSSVQFTKKDKETIEKQVERMLRLTEKDEDDVKSFQEVHPKSKRNGFGRLFRSPSLFEDLVKSILLCNSTWRRTLSMAGALCDLQAELNPKSVKNFPSSREIAYLHGDFLRKRCRSLGYRAKYIIQLAKKFENGKLTIADFEQNSYERIHKLLMKNRGFGPFACANVLSCMGYYHKVPIDTETMRHLKEVHSREGSNKRTIKKDVEEIYDKYAPFQCLAYWFELLDSYENRFGKLSELESNKYYTVTGSY